MCILNRCLSLFILAIAIFAFGCSSSSAPTVEPNRTSGEFGYRLNGVSFDRISYDPIYQAFATASIIINDGTRVGTAGSKNLEIVLNILTDKLTQYVMMDIPLTLPLPGSEAFTSYGGSTGAFGGVQFGGDSVYWSISIGSVTITKFDTVNNLVSGKFSFDGELRIPHFDPTKILHITAGYFNDIQINEGSFGQGTISAAIDGEPFSTASGLPSARISAESNLHGLFPSIKFTAWDGNPQTYKILNFQIDSFKLGRYNLINRLLVNNGISAGYSKQVGSLFSGINWVSGATGTFTLTKFDSLSHRLSAIFDFSGFDSTSGKTIHVANGVIDNVRWVVQ